MPSSPPAPAPPAGYGNTGPQRCWAAAWLICVQTITNLLGNAVMLGVIFAKVRALWLRGAVWGATRGRPPKGELPLALRANGQPSPPPTHQTTPSTLIVQVANPKYR